MATTTFRIYLTHDGQDEHEPLLLFDKESMESTMKAAKQLRKAFPTSLIRISVETTIYFPH